MRKGIKVSVESTVWYSDEDIHARNFRSWSDVEDFVETRTVQDVIGILAYNHEFTGDFLNGAQVMIGHVFDPDNS